MSVPILLIGLCIVILYELNLDTVVMVCSRRTALSLLGLALSASLVLMNPARAEEVPEIGRELGRYTDRFGFQRVYVYVELDVGSDSIVAIAREWHRREPESWFWFLNDDAKAQDLIEALPRTEQGDLTGYPREWVAEHTVANVTLLLMPGGDKRMAIMPGAARVGDPVAFLDE